jgi:hypothetical protein
MPYVDMTVVCGLTADGGFDGAKETDWQHFGIPVHNGEVWEFQFQCCHLLGAPNATVVGSFVTYDNKGAYRQTYNPGAGGLLTDSTAWQRYAFQQQFTGDLYVFPAIWWHAATALQGRHIASAQVAQITSVGASVSVGLSALATFEGAPL